MPIVLFRFLFLLFWSPFSSNSICTCDCIFLSISPKASLFYFWRFFFFFFWMWYQMDVSSSWRKRTISLDNRKNSSTNSLFSLWSSLFSPFLFVWFCFHFNKNRWRFTMKDSDNDTFVFNCQLSVRLNAVNRNGRTRNSMICSIDSNVPSLPRIGKVSEKEWQRRIRVWRPKRTSDNVAGTISRGRSRASRLVKLNPVGTELSLD